VEVSDPPVETDSDTKTVDTDRYSTDTRKNSI